MKNLKLDFNGSDTIDKTYSQSLQDLFVLCCLNGKREGKFLDLGCRHPIEINNTFLLEKDFNWQGLSVDIDCSMINLYSCRKTLAICEDATKLNFNKICKSLGTNHFDYLSLDLEPASITDKCLKSIPFENISFSIITYEHDYYRFGEEYRESSRDILEYYGYSRICSDISNSGMIYEDWYYNPKYISYENIRILESNNIDYKDVLFYK